MTNSTKPLTRRWFLGVQLALCMGIASPAYSQNFPSKAVAIVVPFPAGGLADVVARSVNGPLSKHAGQPVIVENIGGGSGSIAALKVLNAPSDGHNLLQGTPNELILFPLASTAAKFKSDDFRLVQNIGEAQMALITRRGLPANTVDELIALARARAAAGTPLTYASTGQGSFYHLLGEFLSKQTGIPMTHVPYRGVALAIQDMLAGVVDFALFPYAASYDAMSKKGDMKVLAILNQERVPSLKDYPAIGETAQLKNFAFTIPTGYFVKKDTPEPVVVALHKLLQETLKEPSVRGNLEANSMLPSRPMSLKESADTYQGSTDQFRAIWRSIGLTPQ